MASATSLPESSSEYRVRLADSADTDALVRLINAAFIVEKPIIDGDRINAEKVSALFETGKFLLLEEGSQLVSCIYAEIKEPRRGYLGLLAVGFCAGLEEVAFCASADDASNGIRNMQ